MLNTADYYNEFDRIVSDERKLIQIQQDPTEALKKKFNSIIDDIKLITNEAGLSKQIGVYGSGFQNNKSEVTQIS